MWLTVDFSVDSDARNEISPNPKTIYFTFRGKNPYKYTIRFGYENQYATRTPYIAPLAPTTGMVELTSEKTWIRVAHIPQNK